MQQILSRTQAHASHKRLYTQDKRKRITTKSIDNDEENTVFDSLFVRRGERGRGQKRPCCHRTRVADGELAQARSRTRNLCSQSNQGGQTKGYRLCSRGFDGIYRTVGGLGGERLRGTRCRFYLRSAAVHCPVGPHRGGFAQHFGLEIQSLCARRTGRGENGDGEKQTAYRARAHLLL